jgi:hypothetical protein
MEIPVNSLIFVVLAVGAAAAIAARAEMMVFFAYILKVRMFEVEVWNSSIVRVCSYLRL